MKPDCDKADYFIIEDVRYSRNVGGTADKIIRPWRKITLGIFLCKNSHA